MEILTSIFFPRTILDIFLLALDNSLVKACSPPPWEQCDDLWCFTENIYFCLSLQYVAAEVVEDEGEEQVEDHKVANDESWDED